MKIKNSTWYLVEGRAQQWFLDHGYKCVRGELNQPNWDLLVDDKLTVNVKYSHGRNHGKGKLEFYLHTKNRPCFTARYLLTFYKNTKHGAELQLYLVPYFEVIGKTNLGFRRNKIPSWLVKYKLN